MKLSVFLLSSLCISACVLELRRSTLLQKSCSLKIATVCGVVVKCIVKFPVSVVEAIN